MNSNMRLMYVARYLTITPIYVTRLSEKYAWHRENNREVREARNGLHSQYCETLEEAKAVVISRASKEIEAAQRVIERAEKAINKYKGEPEHG